jgi:hypothetical protein
MASSREARQSREVSRLLNTDPNATTGVIHRKGLKLPLEKIGWFRERRGLFEVGAKLGMQSQQERFVYQGCDPAILAIMEKYF